MPANVTNSATMIATAINASASQPTKLAWLGTLSAIVSSCGGIVAASSDASATAARALARGRGACHEAAMLVLSKVLWIVGQPLSAVLILMLLGLLLSFTHRRWLMRFSIFLGLAIGFACCFTSVGYLLIKPLESRFAPPTSPPTTVAGIIVLGGAMDADVFTGRKSYELNRYGDRFVETLRLALAYPEAKIVISGGGSVLEAGLDREAEAGARFFEAFGISRNRLVLEDSSRTTEENVENLKQSIAPKPGETWLLVTSAFHMPRSAGLFRKAGLVVVPWPVDYQGTGEETFGLRVAQPVENLTVATVAVREWLALSSYKLTGRIDDWLPAPVAGS